MTEIVLITLTAGVMVGTVVVFPVFLARAVLGDQFFALSSSSSDHL
tara:strand:- start:1194 stop:1331 length:138 start_codon:yes stop_codon:yes gene_type:complete